MSGDLVSLRMIIVSAHRPVRELWRQGAALASVPMEIVEADAGEARAALAKGGFDIVMLDSALAGPDRDSVIAAASAIHPRPHIAVSAAAGDGRVAGVRTMPKPNSAEEARVLVERCVRVKLPTRILVVDDSSTMRGIVRKILGASRYTLAVSEADGGVAALDRLSANTVDVVLLDYNMPGGNGLETLAEIRRVAPRVAVVMMTSTVNDALRARVLSSGATAFLTKPFYSADIDAILDRLYDVR